ncbi:hypothetical protein LTR17_018019 [Elasticomyces elasticus]|nr:hypothetical protein LTR17_018019 [Elasticomyces elasticus]
MSLTGCDDFIVVSASDHSAQAWQKKIRSHVMKSSAPKCRAPIVDGGAREPHQGSRESGDFLFVTVPTPGNNKLRSHVMKKFLQHKKAVKRSTEIGADGPLRNHGDVCTSHEVDNEHQPAIGAMVPATNGTVPETQAARVRIDPCLDSHFGTVPMDILGRSYLHQYMHMLGCGTAVEAQHSMMLPLWMPLVLSSELAYNAVSCYAASHGAIVGGQGGPTMTGQSRVDSLTYNDLVVQQISRRLQEQDGLDDITILCVAQLLRCELLVQSELGLLAHLAGLAQMVVLRGGIATFPKEIRTFLKMTMTEVAMFARTKPHFDYAGRPSMNSPSRPRIAMLDAAPYARLGSAFRGAAGLPFCERTLAIVEMLRDVTLVAGDIRLSNKKPNPQLIEYLEDLHIKAENDLLCLHTDQEGKDDVAQQAVRVTLMIYSIVCITRLCPASAIGQSLSTELLRLVVAGGAFAQLSPHADLLFWILFQGFHASRRATRREFLRLLHQLLDDQQVDAQQSSAEHSMEGWFYVNEVHGGSLQIVWDMWK